MTAPATRRDVAATPTRRGSIMLGPNHPDFGKDLPLGSAYVPVRRRSHLTPAVAVEGVVQTTISERSRAETTPAATSCGEPSTATPGHRKPGGQPGMPGWTGQMMPRRWWPTEAGIAAARPWRPQETEAGS